MKINRITPDKHKYLQMIDTIAKKPKALYYTGKLPATRITSIAIVGTRKPSAYGNEVAHQLAFELARQGIIILSGLALGIDSVAHRGALEANGTTIAILANSVDTIYPRSHADLAQTIIAQGGAIMSEYESPTEPRGYRFLERNRIVSGLADAVVVVEAAARSGTLNTAAHALEQGRELFVVPGNITSPLSAGCNSLLKQGAHPVTCTQDILEVIAPRLIPTQTTPVFTDTPLEATIISLIQKGERDGDTLQQKSAANAADFSHAMTMLEINGHIRALGANKWTIK